MQTDQDRHILDLARGLDFLNPKRDGVAFAKRIGLNGSPAKSYKHEWTETRLASRREADVSMASSDTTLTVSDANEYTPGETLKIEDEVIRVTSIADDTTLNVSRAEAGTSAADHTTVDAVRQGTALVENSEAGDAVSDGTQRLFNFVQTFDRPVELSTHAIAQLSTEPGNPMQGQLKRRFIEAVQQVAAAVLYGVRFEDASNARYFMGGLTHFVETHVTDNAGSDITEAALDDMIKSIVDGGGSPKMLVVNTTQKLKLDKLDNERVRTGKKENTGGGAIAQTWQSGLLDYELEIIVDHTLNQDEIWIIDDDRLEVKPMQNNGAGHPFRMLDATANGQDGRKQRILGHYTFKVEQEKAHGFLHNNGT